MNASGLTPVEAGETMTFREAEVTLLCRKIMKQPLDVENMPEEVAGLFYEKGDPHDMYIGEVIDIIE